MAFICSQSLIHTADHLLYAQKATQEIAFEGVWSKIFLINVGEQYFDLFYYHDLLLDFFREFGFTSSMYQLITAAAQFEENILLVIKLQVDEMGK